MKKLLGILSTLILSTTTIANVVGCSTGTSGHTRPNVNEKPDELLSLEEYIGDTTDIMINTEEKEVLDEEGKVDHQKVIELFIKRFKEKHDPNFDRIIFDFETRIFQTSSLWHINIKTNKYNTTFKPNQNIEVFFLTIIHDDSILERISWIDKEHLVLEITLKDIEGSVAYFNKNFIETKKFGLDTLVGQEYLKWKIQYQAAKYMIAKWESVNNIPQKEQLVEGIDKEEKTLKDLVASVSPNLSEQSQIDVDLFVKYANDYVPKKTN